MDPAAGPFALLGVEPERCDEATVETALRARLDRLARHVESSGPEGEQVRLALHVAAAQLRDPAIRAELLFERRVAERARPTETPADSTMGGPRREFSIEEAVARAIAASHGWNRAARRRLFSDAAAHGVGATHAARAAAAISRGRGPREAVHVNLAVGVGDESERSRRVLRRWVSFGLLIAFAVSTVLAAQRLIVIGGKLKAARVEAPPFAPAPPGDVKPVVEARTEPPRPRDPVIIPGPRAPVPESSIVVSAPATPVLSDVVRRWVEVASRVLREDANEPPTKRLARAVALARVNRAAGAIWAGNTGAAEAIMAAGVFLPGVASVAEPLEAWRDPGALTSPGVEPDGVLALELLAIRRQPGASVEAFRNRRFTHLRLGPVDCDAAADAALFGSPQDLRLVARKIVAEQADNPAMIHALLEALPKASKQSPLSALVADVTKQSLPPIDDPAWEVRARAALVERLAALLAAVMEPGVDALAEMLGEAYAGDIEAVGAGPRAFAPGPMRPEPGDAANALSIDGPLAVDGDSRGVEAAVEEAWRRWIDAASPYRATRAPAERMDEINRLRRTRLALARGPVQRFIATQTSIVEVMALVVLQESPSSAVDEILDRARLARRDAAHAFEQIEANEEGITRLWMIRFGAERGAP